MAQPSSAAKSISWPRRKSSFRNARRALKDQLQAQLDRPRSARTEHRVGAGDIGCLIPESETRTARGCGIGKGVVAPGASKRVGDVGMIEKVEGLGAELSGQALLNLEDLRDREIHVVVRHAAEEVVARCPQTPIRRRDQDRASRHSAGILGADSTSTGNNLTNSGASDALSKETYAASASAWAWLRCKYRLFLEALQADSTSGGTGAEMLSLVSRRQANATNLFDAFAWMGGLGSAARRQGPSKGRRPANNFRSKNMEFAVATDRERVYSLSCRVGIPVLRRFI